MDCLGDMNGPTKEQREAAFTAYALHQRGTARKNMVLNSAITSALQKNPFKAGTLIGEFFKRAQKPEGFPLAEMMQVCAAAGCNYQHINRQLYKGVSKNGYVWDIVLKDEIYYISNVRPIAK